MLTAYGRFVLIALKLMFVDSFEIYYTGLTTSVDVEISAFYSICKLVSHTPHEYSMHECSALM
jgi:hypothetical protein